MDESSIFTFAVMVFIAVFLLVQGTMVPVFGESRKMRRLLKSRLDELDGSENPEVASILRDSYLTELRGIEKWIESLPVMEALRRIVEQSGMKVRAYRMVLLSIALGIGAFLLTWMVGRIMWLAGVTMLCAALVPYFVISRKRAERMMRIEEQLPDAIDVIRRALRAGHPFNSAIKLVAEDMKDPIAKEFEATFSDINYGNDVRRAMLGFLARVPSVTVMTLVTAVLVQRETGGNLAEILGQISSVVRGRFRFQRKVKTLSAEGRLSTWILAFVPLVMFVVISITNPDYLPMLLEDPTGQNLVAFAFIWGGIGVYLIRRIIRIEV